VKVWGASTETPAKKQTDAEWMDINVPSSSWTRNDVYWLIRYFRHHPDIKFGTVLSDRDTSVLSGSIKGLLDSGLTAYQVRRMIDQFHLAYDKDSPALAFCNHEFQDRLKTSAGVFVHE
jgi:hypothetical protein